MKSSPYVDFANGWTRVPINSIDDLSDAIYGAGLEATQMAKGTVSGSLAFAQKNGITYSSGLIFGTVTLTGPLSPNRLTVGVGLHFPPGSWHWMNEVTTGVVGVFHAGDEHDCHYTPGALYAGLTLDADRLEEEAARAELVLDRKALRGTGLHARHLHPRTVAWLRERFERIHSGRQPTGVRTMWARSCSRRSSITSAERRRRAIAATAVMRTPRSSGERDPISPNISPRRSSWTTSRSRRTRLVGRCIVRLPRCSTTHRRAMCAACASIESAMISRRMPSAPAPSRSWPISGGMSELGRMSCWSRELFGERPSETHAHARNTLHKPILPPG